MRKPKRRSDCPISFALDIFGDKWTLLIIRDIMFVGKCSYGDFLNSEEGIATNILADRLARLEEVGILKKAVDPQNRSKYLYYLTNKGIDLIPILVEISNWSAKYDAKTAAPKELITRIRKDRAGYIREVSAQLKSK